MNWCSTCGARYRGNTHNCGWTTVTKDRLRDLEYAERELRERGFAHDSDPRQGSAA